jgi:2,4-dienoyl-CoA reductase-like NADH-dependent reductase (Old Yellow Enzyme family)
MPGCSSPMCEYSSEDGFANDWTRMRLADVTPRIAAFAGAAKRAVKAGATVMADRLGIGLD